MHASTLLLTAAVVCLSSGLPQALQAQPIRYPAKPVRMIVPFAPGGGADLGARQIAARLSAQLGQQFVIDNRGGSGGLIGMEIAAAAAPDGYTLLFSSASYAAAMAMRKAHYTTLKGLTPIVEIGVSPYALGVHPSLPDSLKGLLDLARDKPGQLSYASPGIGGLTHLATKLLLRMTKVNILHVPYKGAGVAMPDLLSGRTPMLMTPPIGLMPYFRNGRLRALAVTGSARMPELPEVPTVADTVPGYVVMTWYAVLAPGGTPRAMVNTLNAALNKVVNERDLKKSLESQGIETTGGTPERLAKVVREDYERWSKVVKDAGITAE
jgi:tripartite-type tricarboxylate transporter receptor subunit TctC